MIFGPGRAAFLEFLRNLSSLTVLCAIATVLGMHLDTHKFDPGNIRGSLPYVLTSAIFFAGLFASVTRFLEDSCTSATLMKEEGARLNVNAAKGWDRLRKLWVCAKKGGLLFMIQISTTTLVVIVGFIDIQYAAVPQAMTLHKVLNADHG